MLLRALRPAFGSVLLARFVPGHGVRLLRSCSGKYILRSIFFMFYYCSTLLWWLAFFGASQGHADIVEMLLEAGCNQDAADKVSWCRIPTYIDVLLFVVSCGPGLGVGPRCVVLYC